MPAANQAMPPFRRHPHLYEINTWAWLEDLSAREDRPITLGSVPDEEWDHLKTPGFDFVWLMGVWKRSIRGRRIMRTDPAYFTSYDEALPGWSISDVVGSPYSIQAYTPDPRIGSWKDLDAARNKLNARGMRLILDFVPNHTGLDHPWITAHPEYYIQGKLEDFRREPPAYFLSEGAGEGERPAVFIARGKDPYYPAWPDTAQLNYFHPAVGEAMLGVLRTIAAHADGVRCDMAMLVLNDVFAQTWGKHLGGLAPPRDEFWPAAVAALPGFVWMGEVYWDMEWRLQQLGLNFTYDKRLYDRLRCASPQAVRGHLSADLAYQSRLVRFLENHDEPRSAAVFGAQKLPAVATLVATLPGMRFYYQGQLEGQKIHLPIPLDHAARGSHDPANPEIQALYARLLAITREDAFHAGDWRLLEVRPAGDSTFENLIAYQWRHGGTLKVIAVNLGSAASAGNLVLDSLIETSGRIVFQDQLNAKSYEWQGKDLARSGLYVRLEAFRSHVFDVAPQ
ncbi:MAG: alpha-amylase family glycosyl hydrolase [Terriglobia bacterium]